jgi:guanine nucleotide-binding protein G(I)/G(S)/G(T) subunit beta-1
MTSAWQMTVALSPTNEFLACGGLDNACSIYSLAKAALVRTLDGHEGYLSCARFRSEFCLLCAIETHTRTASSEILTSSGDTTLKLWEIEKGSAVSTFEGHTADVMR